MGFRNALVVVSLILSVIIGIVISRGGSSVNVTSAKDGKLLIGLSMDTLKESRWQGDRDIFIARCKKLGAEVLVQSANGDDIRQISDVEALISRGVKVLVIVPHDGTAMAKAVGLAHDAGIPVIAYDRIVKDCDLDLYLSFNNVKVGEMQAQYVIDHLKTPGKGKIVRIYGSKTDNNAFQFKEGQDNVLNPYIKNGSIQVVHEDWAEEWKPESAKKITNAAITKYGDNFDAVLASNDGTAGGAIQALTEEGIKDKIVTGQDAELVACQRIVNGSQSMTIYKPLKNLAEKAVDAAINMAKGKPIIAKETVNNGKIEVPSILCDVVLVTKENMMDTIIKDRFYSKSAVYSNTSE